MQGSDERLTTAIQESICTCIAFGTDDNAAFVASAVDVTLLDPPLNDIVARCLSYRKKYKKAPGTEHVEDIFGAILGNSEDRRHNSYQRILQQMVRLSRTMNTRFIADQVGEFNRRRNQRIALYKAADLYTTGGDGVADQIDTIFRESLKATHTQARNTGFTLADTEALGFLDRNVSDYCHLGIEPLDRVGCCPERGTMLVMLAARNRGKSMFMTHCSKMALLKGWTVVHYTLENSARMTAARAYQSLLSGVRHVGDYHYTAFEERHGTINLRSTVLEPDFVIDRTNATRRFLSEKMQSDVRFRNLVIKEYPTGTLSMDMLLRDLDEMELLGRGDGVPFVPTMVLVDYPQIMQLPGGRGDKWEKLEDLSVRLRGEIAVARNVALVVPQQGTRAADDASEVRSRHGSGSIGLQNTADCVITLSQSDAEEKVGLARLYSQKVRNDTARQQILISQHLASAQFCLDAHLMDEELRAKVSAWIGRKGDINDDDETQDEDEGTFRAALRS